MVPAAIRIGLTVFTLLAWGAQDGARAVHVVQIPISASVRTDTGTGFNVVVMSWDEQRSPDPLRLQWEHSQVPVRGAGLGPLAGAFDYAVNRLAASNRLTGTLSLSAGSSAPTSAEGPSGGAALAVGFLAVLKGDRPINGIALTGTLEPTGRIGAVRRMAEKMKAAARSGYRVLLVPRGQLYAPRVNVVSMGVESSLIVREVGTVDEAYEIMTGKKL